MSDDFGSSLNTHTTKKKRHKKGKSTRLTTDDFDAEWDSIPNKPPPPKKVDPPKTIAKKEESLSQETNPTESMTSDSESIPTPKSTPKSGTKSKHKKKKKKRSTSA